MIGYDAAAGELYVDRTRSGDVGFSRDFPGVQRAPLAARDGKVHLRILVDWSSVEVFADGGQTVITDQVFPSAASDGVQLFADGGRARIHSIRVGGCARAGPAGADEAAGGAGAAAPPRRRLARRTPRCDHTAAASATSAGLRPASTPPSIGSVVPVIQPRAVAGEEEDRPRRRRRAGRAARAGGSR